MYRACVLHINGMTCMGCVSAIETALINSFGILAVDVSF